MSTAARLIATFFTATPVSRWLTGASLTVVCTGLGMLAWLSMSARAARTSGIGPIGTLSSHTALLLCAIAAGLCGLFLAGTPMVALLDRFARSRQAALLPHGRIKVLASATAAIMLLALPVAFLVPLSLSIVVPSIDVTALFVRSYIITCLNLTLLYLAYWVASTRRTPGGRLAGAMIVVALILGPSGGKYIQDSAAPLLWPLLALLLGWSTFAVLYVRLPQARAFAARLRDSPMAKLRRRRMTSASDQIDLLLGTAQPWRLALVQLAPILVATHFVRSPQIWLFYLALFSAVSGAVASTAAHRARPLWLRAPWTRTELFVHVERRFWRHNSYAVGLLILALAVGGAYLELPIRLVAYGIPLLLLGSAASTYLGLMMTRPLGWQEITLGVLTMGLLMSAALVATMEAAASHVLVVAALACLVPAFRVSAARRWRALDWAQCSTRRVTGLAS